VTVRDDTSEDARRQAALEQVIASLQGTIRNAVPEGVAFLLIVVDTTGSGAAALGTDLAPQIRPMLLRDLANKDEQALLPPDGGALWKTSLERALAAVEPLIRLPPTARCLAAALLVSSEHSTPEEQIYVQTLLNLARRAMGAEPDLPSSGSSGSKAS
jgi:hypothetical protein